MNNIRAMFIGLYILGAILLLAPVSATAGPQIPGEPVGTHVFCNLKTNTIGSKLGSAQPLRVHGTCQEILSISDTRVNITIIGDGAADVRDFGGSACDANAGSTTIYPDDPSASEIVQVRGKNILITALNIFGLRADDPSIKPPVGPLALPVWNTALCTGAFGAASGTLRNTDAAGTGDSKCQNARGIRAQRGGFVQIGRNTQDDATKTGDDPGIYVEKSGVCIKNVGSNGIEITQASFGRIVNSEVVNAGGDAVLISEGSAATIGFTSGGQYKLDSSPTDGFRGPGHGGGNRLHNVSGNGVNVDRGSEARITGNYIAFNGGTGIAVARNSQADVSSNVIDQNLGSGLALSGNSNVTLGSTFSSTCPATSYGDPCSPNVIDARNLANTVTLANTSFGIKCTLGGAITGRASTDRAGGTLSLVGNGGAVTSKVGGGSGIGFSSFGAGVSPTGEQCIDRTT